VAALLAAGANAGAQNKQGSTPLHYAAGDVSFISRRKLCRE
jgi:ankyrin repeat protein